jgi:hypothetical protein
MDSLSTLTPAPSVSVKGEGRFVARIAEAIRA